MVDDTGTLPNMDIDLVDVNSSYGYQKQESIQFKDIVLRAMEKCRIEGSKEMTKGGRTSIFSRELNSFIPITIPDQRKVYQQCIEQLFNLLFFYFDDIAKEKVKDIRKNIEDSYTNNLNNYLKAEIYVPFKLLAEKTRIIQSGKESGIGLFFISRHEDEILSLYNRLYMELIMLFKRKKDLSMKRGSSDRD
jgi:hypothetical protein